MDDCVFCKIVRGALPCYKVYENDKFLAFLDIYPNEKGHTVIIPKEHYKHFFDYPDLGEYLEVVKTVRAMLQKGLGIEFVYISVKGRDIAHAHIHLIPSYENIPEAHIDTAPLTKGDAEVILKKILN